MITEKQSLKIKMALLKEGKTVTQLAKEYEVERTFLSGVISGKRNSKEIEEKLKVQYLGRK
jgi:hypothetical protein